MCTPQQIYEMYGISFSLFFVVFPDNKSISVKEMSLCHRATSCPWWCYVMETFSALLAICEGKSPVTGELPIERPMTRSFVVFLDLRLNNDWINNREAGNLRRHCVHYDVTVMLNWWGPRSLILYGFANHNELMISRYRQCHWYTSKTMYRQVP